MKLILITLFNPQHSNYILSTCNQYKTIGMFYCFSLIFRNPAYMLYVQNISIQSSPISRAQWPHVAGGCHTGQGSSGGKREGFSSLALYFYEPGIWLQKRGVFCQSGSGITCSFVLYSRQLCGCYSCTCWKQDLKVSLCLNHLEQQIALQVSCFTCSYLPQVGTHPNQNHEGRSNHKASAGVGGHPNGYI